MKGAMNKILGAAAMAAFVAACSSSDDKDVAGGASGDMGIVASAITGDAQKGPFVKGSAVTVQGIDCKTLQLTDERFEGEVNSDKGDFSVKDVSLKSTCALFEVTGLYRSEITGKTSSKELTLRAMTDLKDRESVNINILTNLEYERLVHLVTEKGKTFAEAKAQAEQEVLAAFDIAGSFEEFENLNIFEPGDGNAALLAVSVMMQAKTDDAGLAKRIEKFEDSFAETGMWKDSAAKAAIEAWQVAATADGTLDSIRKHIEAWDIGDTVAAFEKYVEAFGDTVILSSDSLPSSSSTPVEDLSSSSVTLAVPCKTETEDNCEYGTLTDERDGQTYKTVKIGDQVWMAENLNYSDSAKTASLKGKSWCYDNDSDNCVKYGRLYTWAAAIDSVKFFTEKSLDCGYGKTCALPDTVQGICPSGWRLPRMLDWEVLFAAVGGEEIAGKILKTQTGWNSNGNGVDAVGFSGWPAGDGNGRGSSDFKGAGTYFWSSTESGVYGAYFISLYYSIESAFLNHNDKDYAYSVRCVKGSVAVPKSSSSSENVILSGDSHEGSSSSSVTLVAPCKTETEDNCEYGTLTDFRDGQTYKTVKIGDMVWMAENLNYAYLQPTDSLDSSSFCYNDSLEYCEKYGRLYTWAAAVDSAGLFTSEGKGCGYYAQCTFTKHIRGVCPDGWHVPDTTEYQTLIAMVSGDDRTAGRLLKSSSGWNKYSDEIDGNGVDAFGFAVLPAGYGEVRGKTVPSSGNVGSFTRIWTATDWNDDLSEYGNDVNGGLAYYYFMHNHTDGIGNNLDYKTSAYPVRCVKD